MNDQDPLLASIADFSRAVVTGCTEIEKQFGIVARDADQTVAKFAGVRGIWESQTSLLLAVLEKILITSKLGPEIRFVRDMVMSELPLLASRGHADLVKTLQDVDAPAMAWLEALAKGSEIILRGK